MVDKLFRTPQDGDMRLSDFHVVMTSEFSGMGTAELALQLVFIALGQRFRNEGDGVGGGAFDATVDVDISIVHSCLEQPSNLFEARTHTHQPTT